MKKINILFVIVMIVLTVVTTNLTKAQGASYSNDNLPSTGQYVGYDLFTYPGSAIQVQFLALHQMSPQSAPPAPGSSATFPVQLRFALSISTDNGATWDLSNTPGSMTFSAQYSSGSSDESLFNTELLSIEIDGSALPMGLRLRESPTLSSTGQTTIKRVADGSYYIGSFFDVFTELSLDGGSVWLACGTTNHFKLHNSSPTFLEHSDKFIPQGILSSAFGNPPVLFGPAVQVGNLALEVDSSVTLPTGELEVIIQSARVSLSLDGGITLNDFTANGVMRVMIHKIHNGTNRLVDMEVQQLDISGGTLPGAVMVRESPTRASTGRTSLRSINGRFATSSFFDIFTEISLDGGATWTPAAEPVCLDLSSSPAATAATASNFPVEGMDIIPPEYETTAFENGVQIRNVALRRIPATTTIPVPPFGARSTVSSFFDVFTEVSLDGLVWSPRSNVSSVSLACANQHDDGVVTYFDTEMLSFDSEFVLGGSVIRLRESPTRASRGKTSLRLMPSGTFQASSFFDIFTEISLDGGSTWSPATGPMHFELAAATPNPRPVITSISPSSGPASTIITISGSGFSEVPSENFVSLGDNTPVIKGSSLTELRVVLTQPISPPAGTPLPISVIVGGLSNLPPAPEFTILPNVVSHVPNIGDLSIRDIRSGDVDGDGLDDLIMLGAKGNCCRGHVIIMKAFDDESSASARPLVVTVTYGEDEDCDGLIVTDADGDGVVDNIGVITHKLTGERRVYIVGGLDRPAGASLRVKPSQGFAGGPGTVTLQRLSSDDSLDLAYSTPAAEGQPAMLHLVKNFDKTGGSIERGLIVGTEECDDAKFSDLDGDGDLDVVAATGNGLYIFQHNVTDFEFLSTQIVDDSHPYSSVDVGDLDGDGHADIVALRSDSGIVNVFLGDPLSPGRVIPTVREAGSGMPTGRRQYKPLLSLADVDGDGYPDIVCQSGAPDQTASVLLLGGMLPGGAVISRIDMDDCDDDGDGIADSKLFTIGKFNGDQDCDFAFSSCRSTTISPPVILSMSPDLSPVGAVITIDGDNLQEASSVQMGDFDASFIRESPTRLLVTVPVAARTMPIPHILDRVTISCPSGECAVLQSLTISPVLVYDPPQLDPLQSQFVLGHDIDKDGKGEIISLSKHTKTGHVSLLKRSDNGSASRAAVTSFFDGKDDDCDGFAVGDLDGDGLSDLCVALTSRSTGFSSFAVLLGDSTRPGMFREIRSDVQKQWLPANFRLRSMASSMEDLDGDGKADIVFAIQGAIADTLVVITDPLSETGFFLSKKGYDYYKVQSALVVASASSSFDIFLASSSTLDVYRFGAGGGAGGSLSLVSSVALRESPTRRSLACRDLNGDGLTDAVILDDDSALVTVCLDKGDGSFRIASPRDHQSGIPTGQRMRLVVADLDNDGKCDIAIDEPGAHFAPAKSVKTISDFTYQKIEWTVFYNQTELTDTVFRSSRKMLSMLDYNVGDNEVALCDLDGDGVQDLVVTGVSSSVMRPPFIESLSATRTVAGAPLHVDGRNFASTTSVDVCAPCGPVSSFSALSDSELTVVFPPDFGVKALSISNDEGTAGLASPITILAVPDMFVTLPPDSLTLPDARGNFAKPVKRGKGLYPIWTNLLEEVVVQGGFQPGATESDAGGGMRVGISHIYESAPGKWKPVKDSAKIRAWVVVRGWDPKKNQGKNWGTIQKGIRNKTFLHAGLARGFDSTGTPGSLKRKFLKGELKGLDPKKTPNPMFAELVALKFNIAASQLGKTPVGFGDLEYSDDTSVFDGMTILEISAMADSAMTYYSKENPLYTGGGHEGVNPFYEDIYRTVRMINRAFVGPLDTATFEAGRSLTVNGTVDLATVPFLKFSDDPLAITSLVPTTSEVTSDYESESELDETDLTEMPVVAKIFQNYPNPFNPKTVISFQIRNRSLVTLKVFNMLGQEIASFFNNQEVGSGSYDAEFDAGNLASGIYFYRLTVDEINEDGGAGASFSEIRKMSLLK